jgi:hypothetical protein
VSHLVHGITGCGKSTAALLYAVGTPANFVFVFPQRQLIHEKLGELHTMLAATGQKSRKVQAFFGYLGQDTSVVERVGRYIESVGQNDNSIIFITHRCFELMPRWFNARYWHCIVDETPTVDFCFSESLPDNRDHLLKLLQFAPYADNPKYSMVDAADSVAIKRIAVNKKNDAIHRLFQDLAERLAPESPWQVFMETDQIERFRYGEIDKPTIHGLLHASKFDGFASMTFMAADITESLLYHSFRNRYGVEFTEHKRITGLIKEHCAAKGIRHDAHTNGHRLTVLRLTDRPWSKALRKTQIEFEDRTMSVLDLYRLAITRRTEGMHKLWIANNDVSHAWVDGTRLPGIPSGFNAFQGYHCCVVASALLPNTAHGAFLREMIGVSTRQIRRAMGSQIGMQALGRGSIRNPDATEPFLAIVPDLIHSADIAAKYTGCHTEYLLGYDPLPSAARRGAPCKYHSDEERQEARRAQERQASKRYRVINKSHTEEGINHDADAPASDAAKGRASVRTLPIMAADDLKMVADATPAEYRDVGGFAVSHWQHKQDKDGVGAEHFVPTDLFAAMLRAWQVDAHHEKNAVPLFSPTMFAADLNPGHGRTKENAYACRGIVLDVENGELTHEEFASVFSDTEVLVYSSYSHTPTKPRYRICIPTTQYMPPYVSEAICNMIAYRLTQMGYGDADSTRRHGLDTGKFTYSSLFHRPSRRPGGFLTHLKDNRQPLNPSEWIARCPEEVWRKIIDPELADDQTETSAPYQSSSASSGLISYALDRWHHLAPMKGKGRSEFWTLAKLLWKAGLAEADARDVLVREHIHAHNAEERRTEIEHNLTGLYR